MAKQTKRQRKFQATGGIKKRIEKGTIAKGGKIRKARKASDKDPSNSRAPPSGDGKPTRSDDLMGRENLGDLDIDSFFASFSEKIDPSNVDDVDETDNDEIDEADGNYHDDDDDDDDDDVGNGEEEKDSDSGDDMSDEEVVQEDDDEESKGETDNDSSAEQDEGSDDEDIEVVEARMKAQMSKMQRADPEFHDFLKQNEGSLLEFGQEDDDEDANEGAPRDDSLQDKKESDSKEVTSGSVQLTAKLLSSLSNSAFQKHSVKSLKRLISAYKSACHVADANTTDAANTKHRPGESGQMYVIESSKLFDQLMVLCLKSLHEEFKHHLIDKPTASDGSAEQGDGPDDDVSKPINPKVLERAPRWVELKPLLLSFFRSTLHLMTEAKEPELLVFILKSLSKYLPFLAPFPRISELMLKALTGLWSAPLDSSPDYQVVRLHAFLRIRQLALTQPFPFIEECLKKTYLAYSKRAKFGSMTNSPALPTLTFMGNCLVELYSLDFHSSYQHAFVYIRQLALLLRNAMHKKTPDSLQQVFCWQYVHCLKLWVAVLSACAPTPDGALMQSLVYPLTEIILGTARFVSAPVRHLPLTFHCVRLLQQLAAATEAFIPTTSLLLDCLDWKEWTMPPKKTKANAHAPARGLQMSLMLKLGKEDPLRTHDQLEAGINELFVLLNREVELYRYSAGFPEFAMRIMVRLRAFAKVVRNPRWKTYIKACLDVCERYTTYAVQARSKLSEAPRDVKQLECLRPASERSMRERHEESIVKEQKALEAILGKIDAAPKKSDEEKTNDKDIEDSHNDDTRATKKRRKNKSKATDQPTIPAAELKQQMLRDDEILEVDDEVNEGVDWSDDDE
jgi:nucleolar complex protein 2